MEEDPHEFLEEDEQWTDRAEHAGRPDESADDEGYASQQNSERRNLAQILPWLQ
eukprot:CAMPEP_0170505936 /NCGR_PEP_ID=MMETSP0208-20121228/52877_1 /TAXON_ID=197538 /ORGANISM="Strombidium inclinatum, Strain S3" /LENGTH=53 /DNA_ID=CAMNT_0010787123 /DNA_START=661 /DNA_END=822 /DNA_ORIENTATION=-